MKPPRYLYALVFTLHHFTWAVLLLSSGIFTVCSAILPFFFPDLFHLILGTISALVGADWFWESIHDLPSVRVEERMREIEEELKGDDSHE